METNHSPRLPTYGGAEGTQARTSESERGGGVVPLLASSIIACGKRQMPSVTDLVHVYPNGVRTLDGISLATDRVTDDRFADALIGS